MGRENLKEKVVSGLIWRFGERITAQLVSTIISIILARLLMPEDYGVITMTLVFINIANVFVTGSFGNSLIQKKEVDDLDYSSVLYFNICLSLFIYLILYMIAPNVSSFYRMPLLTSVLRVLGLRIPLAAINSIQQAYVSRNMLFKRFFWSTLIGTVISGVVGIFGAYRGWGVWALVAQYMTNTIMDTIVLWFTVKWRPILKFSWMRAKSLIRYGANILYSSLLSTLYEELRSLMIGKLYNSADLAFYNQGNKYPKLIITNINTSISTVLFPTISKIQDDKARVKQMTRRAIQVSSFIIWPMMIGLAAVSEPFIRIILTEKWIDCAPYMRIFCISFGLYPIHTANLEALKAIGRSDLYLKLEIYKKIVGILLLMLCINFGPIGIAWSVLLSGITSSFINAAPNIKLLNYSYKEQFSDILPSLISSMIMGYLIKFITYFKMNDMVLIVLQIICGVILYVLLSLITKNQSFFYLYKMIIEKLNIKKGGKTK